MKQLFASFKLILWFACLTGFIYPMLMTGISFLTMPNRANGSFVKSGERVVGSSLIAQKFTLPKYFHSRPSAVDFNPLPSGGSNLSPTNTRLKENLTKRKLAISSENGNLSFDKIPSDLLYASGSGLDPHISLEAAYIQMDRVSKSRNMNETQKKQLNDLILSHKESSFSYINVLKLNIALDEAFK